MEYPQTRRAALARRLTHRRLSRIAEGAKCVGCGSVSMLSIAFAGDIGVPPDLFAKSDRA